VGQLAADPGQAQLLRESRRGGGRGRRGGSRISSSSVASGDGAPRLVPEGTLRQQRREGRGAQGSRAGGAQRELVQGEERVGSSGVLLFPLFVPLTAGGEEANERAESPGRQRELIGRRRGAAGDGGSGDGQSRDALQGHGEHLLRVGVEGGRARSFFVVVVVLFFFFFLACLRSLAAVFSVDLDLVSLALAFLVFLVVIIIIITKPVPIPCSLGVPPPRRQPGLAGLAHRQLVVSRRQKADPPRRRVAPGEQARSPGRGTGAHGLVLRGRGGVQQELEELGVLLGSGGTLLFVLASLDGERRGGRRDRLLRRGPHPGRLPRQGLE